MDKVEQPRAGKGATRDDIAAFSNKPKPIAVLNKSCRQLLDVKSKNVLSSEAYFIDHAVNHHSEMSPKEFLKIQATLDAPDEVVEDAKGNSIGFIKEAGDGRRILFLRKDGGGHCCLQDTVFFEKKAKLALQKNKP